jgi:23S rRNA (cytidine1920-2'-O)/16S rRNA (cytidine1409-2'-O)-methyltransferase
VRLDRALVARGLARSRAHAHELLEAGSVRLNGAVTLKPSTTVADGDVLEAPASSPYVSRAAHKLAGALDECHLDPSGRIALDVGASTGGFTQVLLDRGAQHVYAIDVGHGQLAPQLAADARVTAIEGLNVRDLQPEHVDPATNLVVADLSFISLTLAIAPIVAAIDRADLLLMVKPQFEVGRAKLNKHGVVTSPDDRAHAVGQVASAMSDAGITLHHIARSTLPGPTGNVEFFVWGSTAWEASDARRPRLEPAQVAEAIERETGGRL